VTWPWRRGKHAEQLARAAEETLDDARRQQVEATRLANESRVKREENGFAEMIRIAMGVK
jgi:hypothetical protein